MKIVFCIANTINPSGMERVLSQRVNYLVEKYGYNITIITIENNSKRFKNKSPYFYFNKNIKMIDLNISHSDFNEKIQKNNYFIRRIKYYNLKKQHFKKLNKVIQEIKPDVLVALGDTDREFCYKVDYDCKKILEHHFNKEYFIGKKDNNTFFEKLKVIYRNYRETKLIDKYDRFLVLTNEDREKWKDDRVMVINNPLSFESKEISKLKNKKIISVGRLEEVKGFDILIDIWKKVVEKHNDWILEIYGEGSLRNELQNKIDNLKLTNNLFLKGICNDIQNKYLDSSLYIMTSRYEGFGMVLIEAMACGLPLISFNCPCGPSEIIKNKENGFLINMGNIDEMVEKINLLIENEELRKKIGKKLKELSYNYSEDKIMNQWKELLEDLVKEK